MVKQQTTNRLLVVNFSSGELGESAKTQIRRETGIPEIVEVHLPISFNLNKPLPPQIAQLVQLATQCAYEKGFPEGLHARTLVIPPGFADAAFILGAWLAYASVGVTSPIQTIRFSTGWTGMYFTPSTY